MAARTKKEKIMRLVFPAMLFALAIVFSIIESLLPPIPAPVPMRLGLSNIAVMFALFFLGAKDAFVLAVLKALFAFMFRGFLPSMLSLGGGLISVAVMSLLILIFKDKISLLLLSVCGAISHNIGQFLCLSIFFSAGSIIWLLPLLFLFGTGTGILTALILKLLMPAIKKILPYTMSSFVSENLVKKNKSGQKNTP